MIKRQEFLADYLAQIVADKGADIFSSQPDSIQILICGFVVEDMFDMMGNGKKTTEKKNESEFPIATRSARI